MKKFINKKNLIILAIVLIAAFAGWRIFGNRTSAPQYQTATVEKGTLISSISSSGTITNGNNLSITTSATGVVSKVYVKNGDKVSNGQKIADLILDLDSQARQAAALSSYMSSKNQLDAATSKMNSLQSAEFKANQKLINDAVARSLLVDDPTYIQENADWLQAEADYKNQAAIISQTQQSISASWLNYRQLSPIITAPVSGVISGLTLGAGSMISVPGSNSTSSQKIGTVKLPNGQTQAVVNISEIDVPNISLSQKTTLTLDAFPGKTFTGKVTALDTSGSVSSGVTTYPATISLDTSVDNIYPNMAVNAKIITNVKNDVLLVPSAAVQTSNGQSTLRVMKNGQPVSVSVEIGDSNDTQTEIISGLNEGDVVVTGGGVATARPGQAASSPFSSLGGGRGFGGGGGAASVGGGR